MHEIHALNQDMLAEGWLDTVKQSLGGRVAGATGVVRNTKDALTVFYKVGSNAEYLETGTFLLKKQIILSIKALGPYRAKIEPLMARVYPKGRRLPDFIKSCIIISGIRYIRSLIGNVTGDNAQEVIGGMMKKLLNLDSMMNMLTQSNGVFAILKAIGIADEYLFSVLSYINTKIKSSTVTEGSAHQDEYFHEGNMSSDPIQYFLDRPVDHHSKRFNNEYYLTRGNCGVAALDFAAFAMRELGWTDVTKIEGMVKTDIPVHEKLDFTTEMISELRKQGLNFNDTDDRLSFIVNSRYYEEWKSSPHVWLEYDGKIYDPSVGQFSDLLIGRTSPDYIPERRIKIPNGYFR